MKITFPHMGNVYMIAKCLLDEFQLDYVIPPFQSKKTLEIGTRYTPEGACLPLKITVGSLIEAAELGADTALMVGGAGPCRFGYYCRMQQEILNDIGCNMEIITLEAPNGDGRELLRRVRRVTKGINIPKLIRVLAQITRLSIQIDEIEKLCLRNRSYETVNGATNRIYQEFRVQAFTTTGVKGFKKLIKDTRNKLQLVPLNLDQKPLKIGIVGEIYGNIDPYTKMFLEQRLGEMGIYVHRYVTISDWIVEHIIKKELRLPRKKPYAAAAKP